MNQTDRGHLVRLQQILEVVPFSASGTATTTGIGAIAFEQDMRALRPYIRKILEGMVLQGNPNFEVGLDYDDPEKLLTLVEGWIEQRKAEGWENASLYSLEYFMRCHRRTE